MLTAIKIKVTQPDAFPESGAVAIETFTEFGDSKDAVWNVLRNKSGTIQTQGLKRLEDLALQYKKQAEELLGATSGIMRIKNGEFRTLKELSPNEGVPLEAVQQALKHKDLYDRAKDAAFDAMQKAIPQLIPATIRQKLCQGCIKKQGQGSSIQKAITQFRIEKSRDTAWEELELDWTGIPMEVTPENLDQMFQLAWVDKKGGHVFYRKEFLRLQYNFDMCVFIPLMQKYLDALRRLFEKLKT